MSNVKPLVEVEKHANRLARLRKLGYVSLIFWPAFLLGGFMAFDASNSQRSVGPYVALFISVAYGVLPFITPRLSLRALRSGHTKAAYLVAALPSAILPALVVLNFMFYALAKYTRPA